MRPIARVALVGPESVGKTALAQWLAADFRTSWVPEYARLYYDKKGVRYAIDDVLPIVRGQLALDAEQEGKAVRVLFSDTDLLTTCLWSDLLYGDCPKEARLAAEAQRWDATLLLNPDVPWVDDPQRVLREPWKREAFFEELRNRLEAARRPYALICGEWGEREGAARAAVRRMCSLLRDKA